MKNIVSKNLISFVSLEIKIKIQRVFLYSFLVANCTFLTAFLFSTINGKFWFGQLFGPAVFVLSYLAVSSIITAILMLIGNIGNKVVLVIMIFAPIVIRLMSAAFGWPIAIAIYGIVIIVIALISCFLVCKNRQSRVSILICLILLSIATYESNRQLQQPSSINSFLQYYNGNKDKLDLLDPALQGQYEFTKFRYGSGKDKHRVEFSENVDIITESVDGSVLLSSWIGFTASLRNYFWGFSAEELPIQGRVWLPKRKDKMPLILMTHGNHDMENFSDEGYSYLGEHLASRGYAFVSVEQNFLNGSSSEGFYGFSNFHLRDENDARAWILLKHIEQWKKWQTDEGLNAFKQVDLEIIILIGHSRGGEAAFTAAAFNKMKHYPDDSQLKFDFDFNIKGIVAIAPSDGMYQPRGSLTSNTDVNYLTIQGTADGDATVFMGASSYSRVKLTNGSNRFKSSIVIHKANHSQFNTKWGQCDKITYRCYLLANYRASTLPKSDQQNIAKLLVTAFVDTVTEYGPNYRPLFQNAARISNWLDAPYIVSNYLDSSAVILADFEEDSDISTGTVGSIHAENFQLWREIKVKHHENWPWSDLSTHAVLLEWNRHTGDAKYQIDILPIDANSRCLGFSISNAHGETNSEEITNYSIEVTDSMGSRGVVELSDFFDLYPLITKKPDLYENAVIEPTFESVQIPFSTFLSKNSKLNLSLLSSIGLIFDKTDKGKIYLDDIHLGKCVM